MDLLRRAEQLCRELGQKDRLVIAILDRGQILRERGEFDEAMPLLKEAEEICRQLGMWAQLSSVLAAEVVVLHDRGLLEEALTLLREHEQCCRAFCDPEGLARFLIYEAAVLAAYLGQAEEGLPLGEEAYRWATNHGRRELAQGMKPVLDYVRAQCSK
jgi:tetratricopeptide (TPR) repeat protein